MPIKLTERTFTRGPQQWRVDAQGCWSVLMFGWWPGHDGRPAYRWMPVETNKVPQELMESARG